MSSEKRFGYEWSKWDNPKRHTKEQFIKWIYPLTEQDFRGKTVLEVGCGNGGNCLRMLMAGAKKVIGIDYDQRTVKVAEKNLKNFKNKEVKFESAYDMKYEDEFDIVLSIGVIHHLENPKAAIMNMVRAAKPDGKVLIWVYGYDGNKWIVKYVNPLRKGVTSKMPLWMLDITSHIAAITLYAYVKVMPQKHAYMKQLAGFDYDHIRFIVFDQLVPRIANYWKKEEVLKLFDRWSVKNVRIHPVNDCSWTAIYTKKTENN